MGRICSFLLLIEQISLIACARTNSIIIDYFTYRGIKRVVGFSCGDLEENFELAKAFNNRQIYTLIWDPNAEAASRTDLRRMLNTDYHQLGISLDTRCMGYNDTGIFTQAAKYSMYGELHKWLILTGNLSQTLEKLNDNAFTVATDVVIAVLQADDCILYDVYNPCKDHGGATNVTEYGTWNVKTGLVVTLNQSKFERRSNLHGMRLKVGIVVSYKAENVSLHEMMLRYDMTAKYGRSKFLYTLLLHISDLFNFTIDTVRINTQRRFDNSGPVFSAFQKGQIDLSASPVAMKVDRLSHGDMVGPVWPIRSCFMFRTISSTKMNVAQFLKPLSAKVWYMVLGMILIATSVLVVILRLEGVHSYAEGYGISVLLTIGALSQQGSAFVPSHYAGRIAFLQIMFFSLLMLNYYSASVVSDRLKNIGEKMNDSLISLAKSNLKIAVEPTPYIHSFLQVSDSEVQYFYHQRWIKVPESNRYLPLDEGLDRVAEGKLAYHAMVDSAYPYIEHTFSDRSICELTEVHLFRTDLAFYVKRKSPFTELMKIGLAKINNVGIRKRELLRWSSRKPFCPGNLLIGEPLSIHEAAPVFIFLCICTGLSILVCIAENFYYWVWPARDSNSTVAKDHLFNKNLNLPSLQNVNLSTLRKLNIFKNWTNRPKS